jgi:phosphoglucomutase
MNAQQNFNKWLNHPIVDESTKNILSSYDEKNIIDSFYKNLEFQTAGMRGLLGPGSNRMNIFTVKKATIGFGQYVKELDDKAKEKGVVIAHDNRHYSREFTLLASSTLNEMGINTYIFDELRPTPQLSFAVAHFKAIGGIMITASHNPKEYNGYKVYDHTGCQITPHHINRLIEIIDQLDHELDIETPKCKTKGKTTAIPASIDDIYINKIKEIRLNPDLDKTNFIVVFSPQHGASYKLGPRLLNECGYHVEIVKEQSIVDPDFSNTKSPNPESKIAYDKAIQLANKKNADFIAITDPDADRVGIGYRDEKGNYQLLTGNQSGALLINYLLSIRKQRGHNLHSGVVYDTIVTSPLGRKIAQHYGCQVESFLTGFKYIGERIHFYEQTGGPHFEFGYEESYGCLVSPFARDKDGLQALLMYTEMTLYYKLNGINLGQALNKLYHQFGFYKDGQQSIEFIGALGQKKMVDLMNRLRLTPFRLIGNKQVIRFNDYLYSISKTIEQTEQINLPSSDVIMFCLIDGSTITVRPSGTEPKCKFYYSVIGSDEKEANIKLTQLQQMFIETYQIKN